MRQVRLTEADDIEAYLTTFERMMEVEGAEEATWAFQLAPQLTGRAQQAYAAMRNADAQDYRRVKEAILRCYNISEEHIVNGFGLRRKWTGNLILSWRCDWRTWSISGQVGARAWRKSWRKY